MEDFFGENILEMYSSTLNKVPTLALGVFDEARDVSKAAVSTARAISDKRRS